MANAMRNLVEEGWTARDWLGRGEEIRKTVLKYIGAPPTISVPPPHHRVLEKVSAESYEQLKIAYDVEEGEEVRAWLLTPPKQKRRYGSAVLCLHGTSEEAKDTQIGAGKKPGRDFGRMLALEGFITLSPDHCCSGERLPRGDQPYDSHSFYERHPEWSMVGKAIWDGQRALDVLCNCDGVDAQRLGVVGHSLGGQGAIFVGAFDERVKAAVSSCGIVPTWAENPKRMNFARDQWYRYVPKLKEPFERGEVPFDLYELAALMAPRAFLNISGMMDPTYGRNDALGEMGEKLAAVWRVMGKPDAFANLLLGGGHDVPVVSRKAALGWMQQWLCG
ncbi:MAG TPA: acetylxylan esterase [Tepidisphaeraceae bacterium]|jgi:dienelactone hydrolase